MANANDLELTGIAATKTLRVTVRDSDEGKSWVAMITDTHPKYNFEREFVTPYGENEGTERVSENDVVESVYGGERTYYEVRGGDLVEVTADDVEGILNAELKQSEDPVERAAALLADADLDDVGDDDAYPFDEDIQDRLSATFSPNNIRRLLRDTYYLGPMVVGKGGVKRVHGKGKLGSGLRRKGRALYNMPESHRESVLRKAVETDLLVEVSEDVDESANRAFAATPRGRDLLLDLDRCHVHGVPRRPVVETSYHPVGDFVETTSFLVTRCPLCEGRTSGVAPEQVDLELDSSETPKGFRVFDPEGDRLDYVRRVRDSTENVALYDGDLSVFAPFDPSDEEVQDRLDATPTFAVGDVVEVADELSGDYGSRWIVRKVPGEERFLSADTYSLAKVENTEIGKTKHALGLRLLASLADLEQADPAGDAPVAPDDEDAHSTTDDDERAQDGEEDVHGDTDADDHRIREADREQAAMAGDPIADVDLVEYACVRDTCHVTVSRFERDSEFDSPPEHPETVAIEPTPESKKLIDALTKDKDEDLRTDGGRDEDTDDDADGLAECSECDRVYSTVVNPRRCPECGDLRGSHTKIGP